MKVTLKTLKGGLFYLEVNGDTATVEDLKVGIAAEKPDMPADRQKLIWNGKILKDTDTLVACGYKEGEFIVVMVAKVKAPAPPAAPSPAPVPATAAPAPQPSPPAGAGGADPAAAAAAHVVTGAGAEAAVAQLCDMGFERSEVERCLRAAFGNPDRAVEYLMGGIPPESQEESAGGGQAAPAPAAMNGAAMNATAGQADVPMTGMPPELEQLRNNPQIAQLAAMLLQNPQAAQSLLPALAQSHPELAQAVQANPQAFAQLLMEAAGGGAGGDMGAANPAAGGEGNAGPPGTVTIRLSPEDKAAVERLAAMGFMPNMAVQAYLACEKNEELAANFLLENGMLD